MLHLPASVTLPGETKDVRQNEDINSLSAAVSDCICYRPTTVLPSSIRFNGHTVDDA